MRLVIGAAFLAVVFGCGGTDEPTQDGPLPQDGSADGERSEAGNPPQPDTARVPGTEGGPCYGNGTCNNGLTCASNLCVRLPDAGVQDEGSADDGLIDAAPADATMDTTGDGAPPADATMDAGVDAIATDAPVDTTAQNDSVPPDGLSPDATTCNNNAIDPGEDCDGSLLGGQTCQGLGFDGGMLACDATCSFYTADCFKCGDGEINGTEQCDGALLGAHTCQNQGFDTGTLACSSCTLNTSGCYDCDPAETLCGSACVDTATDANNCGSCGYVCQGGKTCSGSFCVCPSSRPDLCGDECKDLQNDRANCGMCGRACSPNEACSQGGCVAAFLTSLSVACTYTTVQEKLKMSCTATGLISGGSPVDLTVDPNLIWSLENVGGACALTLGEVASISNTPPTKGEFEASWGSAGCTVDVKATYWDGSVPVAATPLTINIIPTTLVSIAISPNNATIPYLGTGSNRLRVNFKVLATYDNGNTREAHRVKPTGSSYAWVSEDTAVGDFAAGASSAVGQFEASSDPALPPYSGQATVQITVTYREDAGNPSTERSVSTQLTVKPGNATAAAIQPASPTIPQGPVDFGFLVTFDGQFPFDVADICASHTTSGLPYTKHYENYCTGAGGDAFMIHQVPSASTPPQTSASWVNFVPGHELSYDTGASYYFPRQARLTANQNTTGTPAVVEANFDDGSGSRVWARSQVTVTDPALLSCAFRVGLAGVPGSNESALDKELSAAEGNNVFASGLTGYQLYVVGRQTNGQFIDLTEDVAYETDKPAVVNVSNVVGHEGEADMGTGGFATITATDPASGVSCKTRLQVQ